MLHILVFVCVIVQILHGVKWVWCSFGKMVSDTNATPAKTKRWSTHKSIITIMTVVLAGNMERGQCKWKAVYKQTVSGYLHRPGCPDRSQPSGECAQPRCGPYRRPDAGDFCRTVDTEHTLSHTEERATANEDRHNNWRERNQVKPATQPDRISVSPTEANPTVCDNASTVQPYPVTRCAVIMAQHLAACNLSVMAKRVIWITSCQ